MNNGKMVDIIHRVGIKAPVSEVYKAISTVDGIAGWWTEATSGTSKVGKTVKVNFLTQEGNEIGGMAMEVKALDPNKKVHWRFTDGPEEWIDTDATFELKQEDHYTILLFGHKNWREPVEFMAHCSTKWALFLLSLKELVETGTGKPSPGDIKIDNWNQIFNPDRAIAQRGDTIRFYSRWCELLARILLFKNIKDKITRKLIKTKPFSSGAIVLYYESSEE